MGSAANGTPKQRIAAECARHGPRPLTDACVALLEGRPDDVGDVMITVLGGEAARRVLDGREGGRSGYWPRVWADEVHRVRAAARAVTLLTAAGA